MRGFISSKKDRRLFLLALPGLLGACASNQFMAASPVPNGMTLAKSRIYVYSFMDVRDSEFGPTMLAEIDSQLVAELAKASVTARVLRFKDSEAGKYYSTTNSGMSVPTGQTIVGNLANEKSLAANYRLVIFPSDMRIVGAWKYYQVRWELFDVTTNKQVWLATSQGKHLTFVKNDEDPQARAKTIVDGFIGELRKYRLL